MNVLLIGDFAENIKEQLREQFNAVNFIFCDDYDSAKQHISDIEVLVTYGSQLNAELIKVATELKWVMVLSAGVDRLPVKEIKEKNILVTNVRGIHKTSMAEYAISMILQVYRCEKQLIKQENEKVWHKQSIKLDEISGKNLLVLGTGAIGQEVARLAQAFRMETFGISRSGTNVECFNQCYKISELEQVLPKADVVVAVLPSTSETKYLLTEKHFQLMREDAVFLNMGRGDLVKSEVILQAIRHGYIGHAILDVFEEEPLPADHPFWLEENITITPHISGNSPYYDERAFEIFAKNLAMFLKGETNYLNQIDIDRGY